MADQKKSEVEDYVIATAALIGLPIADAYRAAVVANFERSQQIAGLALADPLPDDLVAGPVFRP